MKTNTCQQRHRLTLSVLYVMLACLIMLVAVMDATMYVASGFSSLSRGLSQMHSESSVSGSMRPFLLSVLPGCLVSMRASWSIGYVDMAWLHNCVTACLLAQTRHQSGIGCSTTQVPGRAHSEWTSVAAAGRISANGQHLRTPRASKL